MRFSRVSFLCWALVPVPIALGQLTPGPEYNKSTERVMYFSGSVTLEGGAAPPSPVLIQRVCGGHTIFATWTETSGRFSFKVEPQGNAMSSADASQAASPSADLNRPFGASTQYSQPVTSALRDCEVEAVLPGYHAERVRLDIKTTLDETRVGAMILRPLSRGSVLTVSATSLQAPGNARKAQEKGLAAMHDQRWNAAETEFAKAVKLYPNYAEAWYQLGQARERLNQDAAAADAWQQALKTDAKFVLPYESLTVRADHLQDWSGSERYSHAWIQLDAEDFPSAYLFNAIANAHLNRMDDAERSARQGLRVDKDHKLPRLSYVLGLLVLQKHAYTEAIECLRTYLEQAPNASDAAQVRQQLPILEQAAAAPPAK